MYIIRCYHILGRKYQSGTLFRFDKNLINVFYTDYF